jgi:hypothetical protein
MARVAGGQAVLLNGMAWQPKNGKERVILITSHVPVISLRSG